MRTESLAGKVAVIVGASSGIGRALAAALARLGARLVLAARSEDRLGLLASDLAARGTDVISVPTDVTSRAQVRRLVDRALQRYGQIDLLACCSGVYVRCPVDRIGIEDVERAMATNFFGSLYCVLEVLPHLLQRRTGHIVVVSSLDGKKGIPPDAPYVSSKFALTGFCDVLRQEVAARGVHVCTVFPGRVDTPMIGRLSVPRISPKVPPERVARAIVSGIRRRKPEVVVPWLSSRALLLVSFLSVRLADWLIRRLRLGGEETTAA